MSGLEASLLLGSMHAIVLAIMLRRRDRHRRANRYLATLLGVLSLLLLNEAATLESQQELAASYPDAETIVGVGHEMIWERPDDYFADARAYLREIGVVP